MTEARVLKIMNELHDAGYAVAIWTPEELAKAPPDVSANDIECRMIESGWDLIGNYEPDLDDI